jgi:hypothetical protein
MRTRIKNVRVALPALLAIGAIAGAVAGCGGGGGGAGGGYGAVGYGASHSTTSTTHQTTASVPPAAAASTGIPQHNGGDMDLDNNGGPSDGDGGV